MCVGKTDGGKSDRWENDFQWVAVDSEDGKKPRRTQNKQSVANVLVMVYKIRHISNILSPSEKKIML